MMRKLAMAVRRLHLRTPQFLTTEVVSCQPQSDEGEMLGSSDAIARYDPRSWRSQGDEAYAKRRIGGTALPAELMSDQGPPCGGPRVRIPWADQSWATLLDGDMIATPFAFGLPTSIALPRSR